MANALNTIIDNKHIVSRGTVYLCKGGFGAVPFTSGSAVFVENTDGAPGRISGYDVDRLATDEEIADFNAK